MTISMYKASIPGFVQFLRNLSHVLEKGATHARERGDDPDALLGLRVIDDMLPLSRQVQIATDMARNGASRLAGVDLLAIPDEETTIDQLQARIARVIDYLRAFTPEQIDGSEQREIVLQLPTGEMRFDGQGYLLGFVLPNLYFHVTMTYALLRGHGVPLGKLDYFGVGAGRG